MLLKKELHCLDNMRGFLPAWLVVTPHSLKLASKITKLLLVGELSFQALLSQ